jgi:hypothetical protein
VRKELRTYTQLADERLDALVDELEAKIAENAHAAQSRLFDHPAKRAREYDELVAAIRALISILRRVHPGVREGAGLSVPDLLRRCEVADGMAAMLREHAKKGRPTAQGDWQRALARGADRIIRAHCPGISEPNLRRAVAAVLTKAGYKYPDPKKDVTRFDRIRLRPFPPDPIE